MRWILGLLPLLLVGSWLGAMEQPLPTDVFRSLRAGKKQTVVVYGTSLTEAGPWVPQLKQWFAARYPGKVSLVNSGGSGQHSGWGLANVQAKVVDRNPDLVFIEFAINDAHARSGITPMQAKENLDGIVQAVRAGNPKVCIVLQTMNAALDLPDRSKTPASERPQLSDHYGVYTGYGMEHHLPFVDHYPAWRKLAKDDPKKFLGYAPDGLHPTPAGIQAMTWPAIDKMLTLAEKTASKR